MNAPLHRAIEAVAAQHSHYGKCAVCQSGAHCALFALLYDLAQSAISQMELHA